MSDGPSHEFAGVEPTEPNRLGIASELFPSWVVAPANTAKGLGFVFHAGTPTAGYSSITFVWLPGSFRA